VIQGALTPTEVLAAHAAGADAVKVFPARAVSPGYLRDLASVLPGVRLLPTGGIRAAEIGMWLGAGAWAVGLGSALGTVAGVGAERSSGGAATHLPRSLSRRASYDDVIGSRR
jgi:2-dehydro-3-deoxyphosphogluconate aldolase / (4S)-4-hydroxy-2-oxoglutarate aldolase